MLLKSPCSADTFTPLLQVSKHQNILVPCYIFQSLRCAMDFLKFSAIPFGTEFDMGLVCTRLTDLIGVGSWFDSFKVQNRMWLSLVKKILQSINSEGLMCGVIR